MTKLLDIKLNAQSTCLNTLTEPLVLPCNVSLRFMSDVYVLSTLSVCVKNGVISRKFTVKSGEEMDITELFSLAGKVEISVSMILNGTAVKNWRIEPIIAVEVEHTFVAIPELEALKNEITHVKAAIKDIAAILSDKETI